MDVDLKFDPESCAGPVDYDEIAFTERIYEFHFDPAYIQFLEQCNGGVSKKRYFPVPGNVKVVERFLCVVNDVSNKERHGWYDMGVVTAQIEDRLSDSQVPFAALFAATSCASMLKMPILLRLLFGTMSVPARAAR